MNHFATPACWIHYRELPEPIRDQADKAFELLRNDPSHPSLRLKKVGDYYSARVSLRVRALARIRTEGMVWFWIGDHAEYMRLIKG